MSADWTQVTVDHIRAACDQYDAGCRPNRPAQSTFLLFEGKRYPAKFIRGLAYKIATGVELDPSRDYAGGMETARFFSKLGLATEHQATAQGPSPTTSAPVSPIPETAETTGSNCPLPQKQVLRKLLEDRFGQVDLEAKFSWLIVPEVDEMWPELREIFQALITHRGFSDFATPGFQPRCDFVVPHECLILELDERQHFTEPRAVALDRYPAGLQLGFDVQHWTDECRRVKATDISPPYRDEQRAFYDSLRDILAVRNGYKIIRLQDGEVDWTSTDAGNKLDEILSGLASSKAPNRQRTSASDIEVLRRYMRRSKDDWYWEDPVAEIVQTTNRSVLNSIGTTLRQLAAKRWRESQFTDAEIRRMAMLIRSEAERLGDVNPPSDLVPEESPIAEDAVARLHAEPNITRIALVSHNYKRRGSDGLLGYAAHYGEIARICDDEGCDTMLLALYGWDGRSQVPRAHGTLFGGLSAVRRVILEAGDLEAHSGEPAPDDVGIEIWLRDAEQPFVVRQKFANAPTADVGWEFMKRLPCRQIGSALLLVCGESSIVTSERYGLMSALDRMRIAVVLNPVHTYMRPRGSNDYHGKRLAVASKAGRTAISVWNHGRYYTEPNPWRVFHDGTERPELVVEMPRAFPNRHDLRIGTVDLAKID